MTFKFFYKINGSNSISINKKEFIWILEHPTTFTGGIRSKESEILDKRIKVVKTNRGGKITLHNPGQRIIYFVINLNERKKDIRLFINTIEKSIIEVLKKYNIKADDLQIQNYLNDVSKNNIERFKIEFKKRINPENFKDKIDLTEKLNKVLEEMIIKNPNQWIWTHDRWE